MTIERLLENTPYKLIAGSLTKDITSVEYDSRKAVPGSCFIAVKGFTSDGHGFISTALENGASLIVAEEGNEVFTEEDLKAMAEPKDACVITVPDSRKASAYLAASFFGHPENSLHMIGVTGTKGKTTITYMIRNILEKSGKKTGLIGTVCNMIGDEKIHAAHTTPEARDTYELLAKMVSEGADTCIMEVSSQGLKLDRVYGINYGIGCFTNFYEDHIGGNEHPDMEDYFNCKMKLWQQSETAVVNADIPEIAEVTASVMSNNIKLITYGLTDLCDIMAYDLVPGIKNGVSGTYFNITSPWYCGRFFAAIPGEFNVYNALCAITVAYLAGADTDSIRLGLETVEVPGRLQPVRNDLGITVLVDYAHNAASLENVLKTLKKVGEGKVITVFGCGGDRSHTRRFEMGEVAGKLSDHTIVTSDNPRTEDPDVIIGHIVSAIEKTDGSFETEPDRALAIEKAIDAAKPGDIVLIAGKGHEDYQIFKDRTIHFDDCEQASEAIDRIRRRRNDQD